jgi:hypothetical protein
LYGSSSDFVHSVFSQVITRESLLAAQVCPLFPSFSLSTLQTTLDRQAWYIERTTISFAATEFSFVLLMRSWPVKLATLIGIFVQCIVINTLKRFVQLQDWKESLVGLGENMSMSCHFSGSVSWCGIVAFFECSEPFWVSWTSKRNVQIASYVSFKIHTLLVLEYGGT